MSSRYLTNALLALFGGFVVVASRSFRPSIAGWIACAFGIAIVLLPVLAQLDRSRGSLQRTMDAATLALGGLAIAFGVGASGSTRRWTAFAFALGWAAVGFAGRTVHEIAMWRSARGLGRLHWFPSLDRPSALAAHEPASGHDRPQVA